MGHAIVEIRHTNVDDLEVMPIVTCPLDKADEIGIKVEDMLTVGSFRKVLLSRKPDVIGFSDEMQTHIFQAICVSSYPDAVVIHWAEQDVDSPADVSVFISSLKERYEDEINIIPRSSYT